MDNFNDLYQEVILDHYRHPRGRTDLQDASSLTVHENPTCGDSLKIKFVLDENNKILEVQHDSAGCAISTASVSMMSEELIGLSLEDALDKIRLFEKAVTGQNGEALAGWGDLEAFSGLAAYPMRIKCATLAWHAAEEEIKIMIGSAEK